MAQALTKQSTPGRVSFNRGWTVRPKTSIFFELGGAGPTAQPVTLPHDALIGSERNAAHGRDAGFFPGGAFQYEKTFEVPHDHEQKHVTLEFDGVYRDAVVFVNNRFAGQRPSGYARFVLDLDALLIYGGINTIRVEARIHEDSRWYTGGGIYRDTWLVVQEPLHIATDGVVVTTPEVDDEHATVLVRTTVENTGLRPRTVVVSTTVVDDLGREVARETGPCTVLPGEPGVVSQRLYVEDPRRWNVERPSLYTVTSSVVDDDRVDVRTTSFGIRTLQLDAKHGLRINGDVVKLRGACVHHDNGPIGAATIGRAEERRVELLKAAGFNAIRSAHNPLSTAMIEACDRLGMLVMDELTDVWTESKNSFDYSLAFPEWWERDVDAMVLRDINHPSVIFYSIGNEIFETGDPIGSVWGRRITERVRSTDPTRYVTNGVNGLVSVLRQFSAMAAAHTPEGDGSGVNAMMGGMDGLMSQVSASPLVTESTAESFAILDVAGMNYGDSRYTVDAELFPNRIILGTETSPRRIAGNWAMIAAQPNLLGDFTWTGWDYLGEAGLGRATYADDTVPAFGGNYPWIASWSGDIDITGRRRPASFYREIVFGLRHEPYIAVRRPENYHRGAVPGIWAWSDALSSWDWNATAGSPIVVEVYSDADEVELFVNERSVGRAPAGAQNQYQAEFDTAYERGRITAVAYTDGVEVARTHLSSPESSVHLNLTPDRGRINDTLSDLAYIDIELQDASGTPVTSQDRELTLHIVGPGSLQGFASGRPATEESFVDNTQTTFNGHALAVIRPTGPGVVTVTVEDGNGLQGTTEFSITAG